MLPDPAILVTDAWNTWSERPADGAALKDGCRGIALGEAAAGARLDDHQAPAA